MKVSPIRITCPHCTLQFTIELTKAQAEIDRLEAENRAMREAMGKGGGDFGAELEALFGGRR